MSAPAFHPDASSLSAAGILLTEIAPLIDGEPARCGRAVVTANESGWTVVWPSESGGARFVLAVTRPQGSGALQLDIALEGVPAGTSVESLGLRIGRAANVLRYLRSGYTSWDGSRFVEPDAARGLADPGALEGHAVTALVARQGGTAVLGFLRHDRFQSRFRFAFAAGPLSIDAETLIDGVPHPGRVAAEPLILLAGAEVEETLRAWAREVAKAAPLPPRRRARRITGWCSWYSLYASIDEALILEHLRAAARFRDRHGVPLEVFQIDDGFTPEMGDWLDVKPTFPRGMRPLLEEIRAAGFVPGLWIAPFLVGNRSRLYAEHPDWVVADRATGGPLVAMKFYGEFRWHKRSEEYYVLDVTHPGAEAWIRRVLRIWARDWGCGYFKTDFMHVGSDFGPRQARWHRDGLSRIEVFMRMARLVREEIGDALWLGCGCPLWAPLGLVDAVRIGRDVGVTWRGDRSAESLLADTMTRNFANGILWQADPDCILLRDRFHELADEEVRSLARFAGLCGGVLMTSDHLGELSAGRAELFTSLCTAAEAQPCDFPMLGRGPLRHRPEAAARGTLATEGDPVILQRVRRGDGTVLVNVFNTGDLPADRLVEWRIAGSGSGGRTMLLTSEDPYTVGPDGVHVSLPPHASRQLLFSRRG